VLIFVQLLLRNSVNICFGGRDASLGSFSKIGGHEIDTSKAQSTLPTERNVKLCCLSHNHKHSFLVCPVTPNVGVDIAVLLLVVAG
jgi:hypothetical protein